MSALGQKHTYAVQNVMSALPPIATLIASWASLPSRPFLARNLQAGLGGLSLVWRQNWPPEITASPGCILRALLKCVAKVQAGVFKYLHLCFEFDVLGLELRDARAQRHDLLGMIWPISRPKVSSNGSAITSRLISSVSWTAPTLLQEICSRETKDTRQSQDRTNHYARRELWPRCARDPCRTRLRPLLSPPV